MARRSHAAIATLPKQHGGFRDTLFGWMKDGLLRERVQAMPRPAFMPQPAFAQKLAVPDWFTWNLLTLDVFREWIDGVNGRSYGSEGSLGT